MFAGPSLCLVALQHSDTVAVLEWWIENSYFVECVTPQLLPDPTGKRGSIVEKVARVGHVTHFPNQSQPSGSLFSILDSACRKKEGETKGLDYLSSRFSFTSCAAWDTHSVFSCSLCQKDNKSPGLRKWPVAALPSTSQDLSFTLSSPQHSLYSTVWGGTAVARQIMCQWPLMFAYRGHLLWVQPTSANQQHQQQFTCNISSRNSQQSMISTWNPACQPQSLLPSTNGKNKRDCVVMMLVFNEKTVLKIERAHSRYMLVSVPVGQRLS